MSTILKPNIDSVTIAPNPVNINTAFLIQIGVSEIEVTIDPIVIYCGSFYCGESEIL